MVTDETRVKKSCGHCSSDLLVKEVDQYKCPRCGQLDHSFLDAHPPFCPEPNCICIWHGPLDKVIPALVSEKGGFSVDCFGRMKEPITFHITGGGRDAVHENDMYHCMWTPMKGWVQTQTVYPISGAR